MTTSTTGPLTKVSALPWTWPPDDDPKFDGYEGMRVDAARDGWVEVSVASANGFLPPDKVEEFIAAVRAAAGEAT